MPAAPNTWEVVHPGRIGDPDLAAELLTGQEFSADAQGAGTTRRLSGTRPLAGDNLAVSPKRQLLRQLAIFGIPFNGQIILGLFTVVRVEK